MVTFQDVDMFSHTLTQIGLDYQSSFHTVLNNIVQRTKMITSYRNYDIVCCHDCLITNFDTFIQPLQCAHDGITLLYILCFR